MRGEGQTLWFMSAIGSARRPLRIGVGEIRPRADRVIRRVHRPRHRLSAGVVLLPPRH